MTGEITTEVITLDAARAAELLATNVSNRPILEVHVRRIQAAMMAGDFHFTAEPLKWDTDGRLLDGQHRLIALSRTPGIAVDFLAVRGVPPAAQLHMDQGRNRSVADQAIMAGYATGIPARKMNTVSAAARLWLIWRTGHLFVDEKVAAEIVASRARVLDWMAHNEADIVWMAAQMTRGFQRTKMRKRVLLTGLYAFSRIDESAAETFADQLYTGAGLESGSPILALRDRLDRDATSRMRVSERDQLGILVLVWNHWRAGRPLTRVQRGDWNAANFPVPR